MILGRVLQVRAPFILKLPWYLVVFAKGGRSKSRLLVLQPWKRCTCLTLKVSTKALFREDTYGLRRILDNFCVLVGQASQVLIMKYIVRIHTASGIPVSLPYCCYGEMLLEWPTLFLGNLTQKTLSLVAKRIAGVPRVFSSFRNRLRSSVERKTKNDLETR